MRIGELARLSGVRTATLRYYERRGLVRPAARTEAGYRTYTPESLAQLRLIGWAKDLGFTLREIREMTAVVGRHAAGQGDGVRARVRAKMIEVDRKLERLAAIRGQLAALAACRCTSDCPVIARVRAGRPTRPRKGR